MLHNIKEGIMSFMSNNIIMIKKGKAKWYDIVRN